MQLSFFRGAMSETKQKKLLLVEDNLIIAMLQTNQLEKSGYGVIHALSGEDAIDMVCVKKEPVDLILMDIDLGSGMDGTEAATEILKQRDIPIVFLSAHMEKEIVQKTEKITSYGYVVKDSGIIVLDASIKMAFKLFDANKIALNQQEKLRTILHSIGDAVIATDTSGKIIRINPVAESLTGWMQDEALGKPLCEVFRIINAQTKEPAVNPVELVLSSGKIAGLANHTILISRNGAQYQIADSGSPIKDIAGNITGVVLVFRDVTLEYETQRKIEESEKLYRSLFENMLNGFAYCKMIFSESKPADFVFLMVNKAFESSTGFENVEGKRASEIISGIQQSDSELFDIFGEISLTGTSKCFEIYIKSLKMWLSISAYSTQKEYFVMVFDVITDRKIAEEKLNDSLMKLNSAQQVAKIGFWNLDLSDMKLEWSEGLKIIFGLDPDGPTPSYELFWSYVFEDDKQLVTTFVDKQLKPSADTITSYVYRIVTRSGNIKYLQHIGRQIINNEGKLIMIYGAVQDISEHKLIEEALQTSERQLRVIADSLPAYVALVGVDDLCYKFVNNKFETAFGMAREKIVGRHIKDIIGESNYRFALKYIDEVRAGREASYENIFNIHPEKRWINVNYVPSFDKHGNVEGIIVLSFDITERKRSEEQINNLLGEKEIILREVHHRVKNNMNAIFNLLTLQADSQESLPARNILLDAASRVRSMMALYNKLYCSEITGTISLKEYLPFLIDEIVTIFPKNAALKIKTRIDDIYVNSSVLPSIGIIVNELITNAIKYAFNGRNEATISLMVSKKENRISMIFEDDGNGIPESVTFENSTGFGLQLVWLLIKQMRGNVTIDRQAGAKFIMEFDI